MCRAEQLRALRRGKRVIPVRLKKDTDIPLHLEGSQSIDFLGDDRFEGLLAYLTEQKSASLIPSYRETYVTAPPPPTGSRGGDPIVQKLVGLVVSDESSSRMRTVAIYGDPEKARRAAIALCYDASVQAAFPDGIVWIDAPSTEKQALEQMREAGKALGDDLQRYDSLVGARHQLHTTISKRNILLILHGASGGQMEMLTANAPGSALVATTNRLEIADQAGATCDVGETRKVPSLTGSVSIMAAALAVIAVSYLWEKSHDVFISSDPTEQHDHAERIMKVDMVSGIVICAGLFAVFFLWYTEQKRLFPRLRIRRRFHASVFIAAAATCCIVFRDLRIASVPGLHPTTSTLLWPFVLAVCYAFLIVTIALRTIREIPRDRCITLTLTSCYSRRVGTRDA